MPDLSSLALFFVAAIMLLITPGPAVLFIIARSIEQGRLAGIVSALGMATGSLVHILAATLGISALLTSSEIAFNIMRYLGAAYLIYLGFCKLVTRDAVQEQQFSKHKKLSKIYSQAVIVNLLNPKTALFLFAFLPQFVNTSRGSVTMQILYLGLLFVFMGLLSDSIYAMLSGSIGRWLKDKYSASEAQRYFVATVYIVLGVATALAGSNKK